MNRKKPSSTSGFSTSSSIVISYTCILWFQWGLKHSLSSYSLGMMVECELVDNLSLLFSCPIVSDFLWPHEMQHTGVPALHCLLEFAQTHVHWVSDAIQPSHPLAPPPPSPLALSLSQHWGLFQWVSSSHQVANVLELQHQSFQWIFRTDSL